MMDEDYGDDLDALTSLLDEDEDPYDEGEPFSVGPKCAFKTSQEVKMRKASGFENRTQSEIDADSSLDESKSKQELMEELRQMREQLSQLQGGKVDASQSSSQPKSTAPQEAFSSALFPDSTPKANQKKKVSPKADAQKIVTKIDKHNSGLGDNVDDLDNMDDDDLADLFDDEGDKEEQVKPKGKVTPQKADSLFKKNKRRQAHTPKTNVPPPKKVSPYKCQLCDKTFQDHHSMAVHQFKHKAIHSYTCDLCEKTFTDKLQLQTHLRTHSGSKSDAKSSRTSSSSMLKSSGSASNGIGSSNSRLGSGANSGSSVKSVPQIGSGAKRKAEEETVWETEYFSKIRIVNPLVSSATMKERMKDRKMIRMSILRHYSRTGDLEGDWVTMGVIIRKTTKNDSKGKPFTTWVMNDLSNLEENVVFLLFGKVHEEHWKTAEGSVIGILNASLMEKREDSNYKDSNDVTLKVDHPQKLLLLGRSKDMGRCKARKKDGGTCSHVVNLSECQYCVYHVQQEMKKMGSKRGEFSSSYSGTAPKSFMKKLQKDNFIYGGQQLGVPSFAVAGGGVKSQSKMTNHFKSNSLNLKSLGVKGADALVEEAKSSVLTLHGRGQQEKDTMVKVSGASKEFSDMLRAPSAGSQNLMRHMVTVEQSTKPVSAITAKDLLKQHTRDMASKRAVRSLSQSGTPSRTGQSQSSTPKSLKQQKLLTESTKQNIGTSSSSSSVSNATGADFTPKLGKGWDGGDAIDLDDYSSPKTSSVNVPTKGKLFSWGGTTSTQDKISALLAKKKALALVRLKGPIKKEDPNAVKKTMDQKKKEVIKRKAEENWKDDSFEEAENSSTQSTPAKRRKTFMGQNLDMSQDEMDKIMKAKSSHAGLIAEHEAELLDRYFKEMERKEGLENKMDSVREIKRRVVSCKQCAFTWFAPSDLCKQENHKLHWHEATQRFFRCKDCNSRTIGFDRLPNKTCRSCGSFNYERATMLKERDGPKLGGETLKLRGDEEKWIS